MGRRASSIIWLLLVAMSFQIGFDCWFPNVLLGQNLLEVAQAQTLPNIRKRFEITGIEPTEGAPGAIVEIRLGIDLRSIPNPEPQVLFDDKEAVVVRVDDEKNAINVLVPAQANRTASPLVQVRIGEVTSFPYPGFRILISAKDRFSWILAPIQLLGAIGAFTAAVVAGYILIRARRGEKKVTERSRVLEAELKRIRETRRLGASSSRSTMPARPADGPTDALVQACLEGECVLFAGAAFPLEFGIPTTRELVGNLIQNAKGRLALGDFNALQTALDNGEIESIKDVLDANLDRSFIRRSISADLKDADVQGKLPDMLRRIGFAGAITTNWDSCLAHIFEGWFAGESVELVPGLAQGRGHFLFNAFGNPDSRQFSFTRQNYQELVEENPQLSRFLSSAFTRNSVLFLGCTVEEIEQFISQSRVRAETDRQHLALVPRDSLFILNKERMPKLFGIHLLGHDRDDPGPVLEFLQKLQAKMPTAPRTVRATRSRPKIDAVTLINIGPFEEITIPLEQQWNVLLGNNGCGKSTVLKAIALALCGDDDRARVSAASLLREQREEEKEIRGSIELRFGKDRYRTDLSRDRNRVVVRTRQESPVQLGSWVAFGFPAVRGVPGSVTGISMNRYAGPVVDDVLPLLTGEVDTRLDDLKSWIIDVHNKSEDSGVSSGEREKARGLRDALFQMINDVTPGFDIVFHHLDHDARQIWVRTADGLIPLERLSQGINSTIGWAGSVLSRLHDIHSGQGNPAHQMGLLLIDEIDSHLHPSWQQTIVKTTKDLFPEMNVIATTHSPLVVGSLGTGEGIRFTRLKDRIQVETIQQSFRGYRADQILTDQPFGLKTARDPELETIAAPLRMEFATLLRKDRTPDDDKRLQEVSRLLENGLAVPGETPIERAAVQRTRERELLLAQLFDPDFDADSVLESLKLFEEGSDLTEEKK